VQQNLRHFHYRICKIHPPCNCPWSMMSNFGLHPARTTHKMPKKLSSSFLKGRVAADDPGPHGKLMEIAPVRQQATGTDATSLSNSIETGRLSLRHVACQNGGLPLMHHSVMPESAWFSAPTENRMISQSGAKSKLSSSPHSEQAPAGHIQWRIARVEALKNFRYRFQTLTSLEHVRTASTLSPEHAVQHVPD